MDRTQTIGAAGVVGAGVTAGYAQAKHNQALKWGQSASTLDFHAQFAIDTDARFRAHPAVDGVGFGPFEPGSLARRADDIEFGTNDMLGKRGPNHFDSAAVGPLRRASKMDLAHGVAELRTAASKGFALEATALRGMRAGLVATGFVAVVAGAAAAASAVLDRGTA